MEHAFVAADLDKTGAVVGIELLGLDDETITHAAALAAAHGLAFPSQTSLRHPDGSEPSSMPSTSD